MAKKPHNTFVIRLFYIRLARYFIQLARLLSVFTFHRLVYLRRDFFFICTRNEITSKCLWISEVNTRSTKWPLMFMCLYKYTPLQMQLDTCWLQYSHFEDYAESVPEIPVARANTKVSFLSVSIHGRWVLNCCDKTSQISITEPLQVETARKIIQKKNMKAVEYRDDTNGIKRVCCKSSLNQKALLHVGCDRHTNMWVGVCDSRSCLLGKGALRN